MCKRIICIFLLINCCFSISIAQTWHWAKSNTGNSSVNGFKIISDNNGNSYVSGRFSGTAIFDNDTIVSAGQLDLFLAKFNSNGNLIWIRSRGTPPLNYIEGGERLELSGSRIFVTGRSVTDVLMVYDTSGNYLWGSNTGTSNHRSHAVVSDNDGNVYLVGYFQFSLNFGSVNLQSTNNTNDCFVAKYDSIGNVLWAININGVGTDGGRAVDIDNQGNIYVVITYQDTLYIDSTIITSTGLTDLAIVKFNSNGVVLWVRSIQGPSFIQCGNISVSNYGDVYVCGDTRGDLIIGSNTYPLVGIKDAFIVKFDSLGTFSWVKNSGGLNAEARFFDSKIDDQNNLILCGHYQGTVSFGNYNTSSVGNFDGFIIKYDSIGNELALETSNGSGFELFYGLDIGNNGDVYITGYFNDHLQLGNINLNGSVSDNAIVAKFTCPITSVDNELNDFNTSPLIFPNPASDFISLKLNYNTINQIYIYNVFGQLVKKVNHNGDRINISDLPNGQYHVQVFYKNGMHISKFIKIRL